MREIWQTQLGAEVTCIKLAIELGRKSEEVLEQRQLESVFTEALRQLDQQGDMTLPQNQFTPLQRVSIPILREYLAAEYQDLLRYNALGFAPDFERLIDDIVFFCVSLWEMIFATFTIPR
jgi:5'-3' exonuclease